MKKIFAVLFSCLIFMTQVGASYAVEDPLAVQNNKFGIHIQDENDLLDASNLVNSGGGDWGYVTLVIREEERDLKRWQETFNKMRALHLIPLVRVASKPVSANWQAADSDQIDDWVSFLKNLNWVTKNRYVIVGNEPNHAKEWGGTVNPEAYSDYLLNFSLKLKEASGEFYILPAGLDASAPNDNLHMDEVAFLERMIKKNPKVFDHVDGWNSHSYPNPGFAGSETDTGRGTVRTFQWELEQLKKFGVTKNLPVFITETGWVHPVSDGNSSNRAAEALSKKYVFAYQNVWNVAEVVAVTPFIINYQSQPFEIFSWKKKDGTFYPFYLEIQKIQKVIGQPVVENKAEVQAVLLPEVITMDDKVYGLAYIKNSGQKIWKVGSTQEVQAENGVLEIKSTNPISEIKPGEMGTVLYRDVTKAAKQNMQSQSQFDTILASVVSVFVN